MWRPCRPAGLGGDQFRSELARKARTDFILHVEDISDRLVESFGPEMIAGLGVDKLDVDPHAATTTLHGTFKNITNAKFATHLLQINMLSLVGESSVGTDHENT